MRWMRRIQQIVGGVGMGLVLALSSPEVFYKTSAVNLLGSFIQGTATVPAL